MSPADLLGFPSAPPVIQDVDEGLLAAIRISLLTAAKLIDSCRVHLKASGFDLNYAAFLRSLAARLEDVRDESFRDYSRTAVRLDVSEDPDRPGVFMTDARGNVTKLSRELIESLAYQLEV